MHTSPRFLILCICSALFLLQGHYCASEELVKPPVTEKFATILARVTPVIEKELSAKGFKLGSPVFVRIFKLPAILEVWMEKNGRHELFKSYPVCDLSGYPGPKLREGDWQGPEGFYRVTADQMHPSSDYHLAFNIGYPNEYDAMLNRSGGDIMVHGDCSSMGCFAMNDQRMEEIYTLAHSALTNGQNAFAVHVFPFPLTGGNMKKFQHSPWISFWKNLKEGFDVFERTRQVPEMNVADGRYIVSDNSRIALRKVVR